MSKQDAEPAVEVEAVVRQPPQPERGAGYTRFQATIRIEDFFGFEADESKIRETLERIFDDDLDCEILEISGIQILVQEKAA